MRITPTEVRYLSEGERAELLDLTAPWYEGRDKPWPSWGARRLAETPDRPGTIGWALLARTGRRTGLVGWACVVQRGRRMTFANAYVAPSGRGRGVGADLVAAAKALAEEMGCDLYFLAVNDAAIRMAARSGLDPVRSL